MKRSIYLSNPVTCFKWHSSKTWKKECKNWKLADSSSNAPSQPRILVLLTQTLPTHYIRGILSCSPGHPSIGVDVERSNGPCEQRCCLIQPDLHVGTGIPQRLSTLVLPIVPQTNKDADTFLWKKMPKKGERKTLPPLFLERQSWGSFDSHCVDWRAPLQMEQMD